MLHWAADSGYHHVRGCFASYPPFPPGDGEMSLRGWRRTYGAMLLCLFVGYHSAALRALGQDAIGYNRNIRPLLSDRCFQCHGPDEKHRGAGLRLDERHVATSESDSGYIAIVPGNLDESELIARITSTDADLVMPPSDSGKTLNAEEIELIKRWVQEGGEYEPHWAFVPPKRIDPPTSDFTWSQLAIDQFLLAELEKHGLSPSPRADKVTLLRRVTLDLTGLPPTPEETKVFLEDHSHDAFERVVDRLLDSPRYGEHMARYWLDAIRYGDTHGLHLDNYREMWPYRDWVVRAFNANVPWDELTIMQIAGDLRPEATLDDKIASGYNRCHVTTNEGGSIAEEVYVRNVVDRVSTTGTVYLGLTMGCAVCHDHKFDPVSMRDFYSMFAFFNNLDGKAMDGNVSDHPPAIKAPTPEQTAQLDALRNEMQEAEAQLSAPWAEIDEMQAAWETETLEQLATGDVPQVSFGIWHSVGPFTGAVDYLYSSNDGPRGRDVNLEEEFISSTGEKLTWQARPAWADGKVHTDFSQEISATFIYRTIESSRPQSLPIGLGTDDGVKVFLNGDQIHDFQDGRSVTPDEDTLVLQLAKGTNHLLLKIVNEGGNCGFSFSNSELEDAIPAEVTAALNEPSESRTSEQSSKLQQYYRRQVAAAAKLVELLQRIDQLKQEIKTLEGEIPTTLVMKERSDQRPAFLLVRGQYDSPDKELGPLPRAVPEFLPQLPEGASDNRLGLAQWMIDEQNPLMARVTVNRFWQQCFGIGLVDTADDFGSQGSWPSHPELLDWLAVDFRENGWNVKRLMKQLVMTAAYQQSSKSNEKLQAIDPQNRLLARGPRFRLDAEVIRDQALAVSGLLVEKLGGPGVRPPQPDGLWKAVAYSSSNTNRFKPDTGSDKIHRRSLYTFWKRTAPPPQFSTLDAPSRESCVVRRERTNTPLAALLLLNDVQFVEAARALAQRSIQESAGSPDAIARRMMALAVLREPSDAEVTRLVDMFETSRQRYEDDPEGTEKLLAFGQAPRDAELDPVGVAAWTLVANAVLNLDELLNKE